MLPAVCTKKVEEIPDAASCVHKEGRRNNISMTLSKKVRENFLEISDEIYSLISSIHLQDVRIAFQCIPIPFFIQAR